ncbi:MAG: leucine-rich repeat protein [Clostridia bacterium]|nr:leucine-rich repeat protein [Clostridia bacterium]
MQIRKCSQCNNAIKLRLKDDILPCKKCGGTLMEYCSDDEFLINPDGTLASYNGSAESVRIPDGVTAIGLNAFRKNPTISSVIIPEGVKRIEGRAFAFCDNLKSVSIPNTVNYIGNGAFFHCKSFNSITIPPSVEIIESWCFAESAFAEVKLSEGLKTIGADCFSECESLTSIYLPDSVSEIGERCFIQCYALRSVKLSSSLKKLPKAVFSRCVSLLSLECPSSLREIGFSALAECASLKTLRLNEGLSIIEGFAFNKCNALEGIIEFPDSLVSFDQALFFNTVCENVEKVIISKGVQNKSYPKSIFPNVQELVFKEGVTSIPDSAWSNCTSLKKVSLPRSLKRIQKSAFSECTKLDSVNLNVSGLEQIGNEAFYGCKSLSNIKFGDGLTSIGEYAFSGCSPKKITVPSSVKSVASYAFYDIPPLVEIHVKEGCEEIGEEAFSHYSGNFSTERHIYLPETLKTIGDSAFLGSSGTTNIYSVPTKQLTSNLHEYYHQVSLHCLMNKKDHAAAIEKRIAEIKTDVKNALDSVDAAIRKHAYNKTYYSVQRDELLAKKAQYEREIASYTSIFQKIKKANAEAYLYDVKQKLAANATSLDAEVKKVEELQGQKKQLESFTDADYYAEANASVTSANVQIYGGPKNTGSTLFLSDVMEIYEKAGQPKQNPADKYVVISVPRIDVSDM